MKLIVLTKKWGRNFTGATLATQYFIYQWVTHFDSIDVFTLNVGDSNIESVVVHKCDSEKALKAKVKEFVKNEANKGKVIGYSDDHLGFILHSCGVRYIHTYHGNWPDARKTDFIFFLKSHYFIPLYKKTIRNADYVVNVSHYMERFTTKFNKKSIVIRNGIDLKEVYNSETKENTFLMVGNIDKRKYGYAIKLFKVAKDVIPEIRFDIYGQIQDAGVAKKLGAFINANMLGLKNEIPYSSYLGLINTSSIENLSISVCEALLSSIPVICFDVGGLSEVVNNQKNGYVIKRFSINDMIDAIIKCHDNKLLFDTESLAASFNWRKSAEKYLKVFDEIGENI